MSFKELVKLKEEITEYAKNNKLEAWFYPEYSGVKGFWGTQDIFLVGLNPSSGTFPSKKDKRLYALLKDKNLENIHITDFIKVRAKNNEVQDLLKNKDLIKEQVNFFKKEMSILNPKIIIPMGHLCEKLLKEHFPKLNSKIIRIKHYGFRYQRGGQENVFKEISESLNLIKESYKNLE